MYRIQVTALETFRRYMQGVSSYDTEEKLIERLEGKFLGNDKTKVGHAFHRLIEDPASGVYVTKQFKDWVTVEDIYFSNKQAYTAIEYRMQHPSGIHEVPVCKVYKTRHGSILATGKIDMIEGSHIRDAKSKFRNVDFEEYMDSYQWRFYLDALNLDIFWYDIFEVKGFKELTKHPPHFLSNVTFHAHEPLKCTRYINLHQDCYTLVEEFMEYINTRGFYHLLKTAHIETSYMEV